MGQTMTVGQTTTCACDCIALTPYWATKGYVYAWRWPMSDSITVGPTKEGRILPCQGVTSHVLYEFSRPQLNGLNFS